MSFSIRLPVIATVLAVCAFPLVAQAYPNEIIDFTVSGFGGAGSGFGEIVLDMVSGSVLQFNMSISGLTGNAGFLTDSLFFNDPSLVSHLNADSSISFSYDVGNTSGTYATFNFANRFYINEGPSVQALFATRETSVVIDVPEPASLALLGAGAGALAIARRRRRG